MEIQMKRNSVSPFSVIFHNLSILQFLYKVLIDNKIDRKIQYLQGI